MSEELSRDALLIYLENLRTLETIKHESSLSYARVKADVDKNKKIAEKAKNNVPVEPQKALYKQQENNIKYIVSGIFFIIMGIASVFALFDESIFWVFAGLFFIICGAFCIIYVICDKKEVDEYNAKVYANYNHEMEDYRKRVEEHDRLVASNAEIVSRKEEKEKEFKKLLTDDYNKAQEQLDKAYSVNIIPMQFRNIQGVYYLYDYISTSNQGLSEALMQCNLDAIKQKLDNVIQLQGKAIIQQAQANVAIMKQNQQILETAQATMQNTAVAAKYAQIAAVNSTLALQLDSKQLAYQKANFWLK